MSYNKLDPKYPAILKTLDGKPLEKGTITVSAENHSIDFRSDFVPLYKLGEHAQIVRMQDGVEVICYTGEVYLSAPNLLRIISAKEEILPGAHAIFLYDVELPGQLAVEPQKEEGRFRLFRRKAQAPPVQPARIFSLSMKQVKLTTDQPLVQNQSVRLTMAEPGLKDVVLNVSQVIDFGQGPGSYKCTFLEMDPASHSNLDRFLTQLAQNGKAFF